jgi:hypothetical protein
LPDSVSDCARVVKKIFRRNFPKLLLTGGGSGYEKFLLDSIFPTKLTEFPTKLTEFVPFIFVISQYCSTVKRILPDWLCLSTKLGGEAAAHSPPPPARYAHGVFSLGASMRWLVIAGDRRAATLADVYYHNPQP